MGAADAFVVLPIFFLAFAGTVGGGLAFRTALEGFREVGLKLNVLGVSVTV